MPPEEALNPQQVEEESQRLSIARIGLTQSSQLSLNSVKGYGYDWRMFCAWAEARQQCPLPATTEAVSFYLIWLLTSGKKVSTATRRASAIAHEHRKNGLESPVTDEVRALLRGARRVRGEQPKEMCPLSVSHLRAITELLARDDTPRSIRNKAILVIGFASALRRASLVDLVLADVEPVEQGIVLHVRREKQDQLGAGRLIGLPHGVHPNTCPVRCLADWLEYRGMDHGPLFTHVRRGSEGLKLRPEAIERMIKSCVKRIGLNPALYGGHSLRSGFITEAGEAGCSELVIAAQSGHRSMNVLRKYFRRSQLFKANACSTLGL